jgi:hypothetical protein
MYRERTILALFFTCQQEEEFLCVGSNRAIQQAEKKVSLEKRTVSLLIQQPIVSVSIQQ